MEGELKPKIKGPIKLGEKLGSGGEKIVFENARNPSQVVGVERDNGFHESEATKAQTKARFYFMNILHSLFPEVFHSVSMVGTGNRKTDNEAPYIVMNNFTLTEDHRKVGRLARNLSGHEILEPEDTDFLVEQLRKVHQHPRQKEILEMCNEIDLPVLPRRMGFDNALENYDVTPAGDLQFVDTVNPFLVMGPHNVKLHFTPEKLKGYIERKLTGERERRALVYLSRIERILKDFNTQDKNKL